MCERFIREERFKRAIGGDDSGNVNLCKTIDLSSFDANSDLIKYDGMELDFEQLKNGNDENDVFKLRICLKISFHLWSTICF